MPHPGAQRMRPCARRALYGAAVAWPPCCVEGRPFVGAGGDTAVGTVKEPTAHVVHGAECSRRRSEVQAPVIKPELIQKPPAPALSRHPLAFSIPFDGRFAAANLSD